METDNQYLDQIYSTSDILYRLSLFSVDGLFLVKWNKYCCGRDTEGDYRVETTGDNAASDLK